MHSMLCSTFVHVLETGFYYIKNQTYFSIKNRLTFRNEMFLSRMVCYFLFFL